MKILRIGASMILLLSLVSGCSNKQNVVPTVGEVVSCDSISRTTGVSGLVLPCLDGQSEVYISSLSGPAIINVWGSWCAPCKEEIPFFREFYLKAKGKIDLVGVDVEEAKTSDGADFVVAQGMTWPDLVDPDGRTRGYFGLGVPVTWFIDADGNVAYKKIGVLRSLAELRDLATKYLNVTVI